MSAATTAHPMRYYFHLLNGVDVLLDPEGRDLENLEAVKSVALREVRMLISHEALSGVLDLNQRLEIRDEADTVVHRLEFAEAVSITGALTSA